jgi:raffinose/stachyose/melibiose transport system substrate-binding protein
MTMSKMKLSVAVAAFVFAAIAVTAAPVTLELFSNKQESVQTLQGLIDAFMKENPGVQMKLTVPPDAETVLMTRLTRNDLPDLFSIGGNATYGELARSGSFADMGSSAAGKAVQPAYLDMLARLVGTSKTVFGIPYASNANGVIYNKDKLSELGLKPPATWDQLIALLEKARNAGETPIMFALQDAWTGLVPWNALASNLVSPDFPARFKAGTTSFATDSQYAEVISKMSRLMKYGHDDNFGVAYADGNVRFANGQGVLLLQGNWAISDILKANPKANIGVFPFPVSNDASKNKLVSGVDVLLAVSAKTPNMAAARKFVEFMVRKDTAARYIKEQAAFSAVKGVLQQDPIVEGYRAAFSAGRLSSFADHYYPAGFDLAGPLQGFLQDGNRAKFVAALDASWKAILAR